MDKLTTQEAEEARLQRHVNGLIEDDQKLVPCDAIYLARLVSVNKLVKTVAELVVKTGRSRRDILQLIARTDEVKNSFPFIGDLIDRLAV